MEKILVSFGEGQVTVEIGEVALVVTPKEVQIIEGAAHKAEKEMRVLPVVSSLEGKKKVYSSPSKTNSKRAYNLRKDLGLTLKEFGKEIGVNDQTLRRFELGKGMRKSHQKKIMDMVKQLEGTSTP